MCVHRDRLDSAASLEQVKLMIKDFKKFVHTVRLIDLDNLSLLHCYAVEIFLWLEEYPSSRIAGSRMGVQQVGVDAQFNDWHCWLCKLFLTFCLCLKWFQKPMLEFHFLVSSQRFKTHDRREQERRHMENKAQRTVEALSKSPVRKKHRSS
jgi:hypothetical protein